MTELRQLALWYAAWLAVSALALWVLSRWFARRRLHAALLVAGAVMTLTCIGLVAYAFTAVAGPATSGLRLTLAQRGGILTLIFIAWPFVTCATAAQASLRLAISPRTARRVAFTSGLVITGLAPFALLAAGCAMAGACF